MYDPRTIANAVLRRAQSRGRAMTNLDMQKVVYLLHGAFLRETKSPLVAGNFEAWQFGPVHKVLYDAFKSQGDAPIEAPARRFDPVRRLHQDLPALDDAEVESFLDSNLARFLDIPTFKLVQLTHSEGTPWSRTMEAAERKTNVGMVIPNDIIARYFEGDRIPPAAPARTGKNARSSREVSCSTTTAGMIKIGAN
jgi:uncharacterized phage-associated protein